MTRLWLVRHGPPDIDPSVEASRWPLSAAGEAAVLAVREEWSLPPDTTWRSSPEPKAHRTAELLRGRDVGTVGDLREAVRPPRWYDADEFARTVDRAHTEPVRPAAPGWEPADHTRTRVVGAVRDLLAGGPPELVLTGHGTAWTLLVAALTGAPPDRRSWRAMRMPDRCLLVVDPSGHAEIEQGWGVGRWPVP